MIIEVLLSFAALSAAVIAAMGDTRLKDRTGPSGLTRLGKAVLGIAVIVFLLSVAKTMAEKRLEREAREEFVRLQAVASLELARAIEALSDELPQFWIDTKADPKARDEQFNQWRGRKKVVDYAPSILARAERLRSVMQTYSRAIDSKTAAASQRLLNHSILFTFELFGRRHPDQTLKGMNFRPEEADDFRAEATRLRCQVVRHPSITYEKKPITKDLFDAQISPRVVRGQRPTEDGLEPLPEPTLERYLVDHKVTHAVLRNGVIVRECTSAECSAFQQGDDPFGQCEPVSEQEG